MVLSLCFMNSLGGCCKLNEVGLSSRNQTSFKNK
jgi:hypothetical protein